MEPLEKDCGKGEGRKPLGLAWGILLSLAGGLLMFAAFPPLGKGVCVWVGLVPLLSALWTGAKRTGKRGAACYALYGWLFGLAYFGGSFWWINEVSSLGFVPLVMYLALYPALWAVLMGRLFRPSFADEPRREGTFSERMGKWREWSVNDMGVTARAVLTGAALWVCMEWLRGWVMTGFGWNGLGVALYDGLALAQFAEYVGVTALAFIPAAVNILLWCVGRRLGVMMLREGRRATPWDFFITCALLMVAFVWGSFSANYWLHPASANGGPAYLPVVAIQKNYTQKYKWGPENIGPIYLDIANGTHNALEGARVKALGRAVSEGQASFSTPAWVIWPESSLPTSWNFDLKDGTFLYPGRQYNHMFFSEDGRLADLFEASGGFVFITGEDEVWYDADSKKRVSYNAVSAYPGKGYQDRVTYRKTHLVPFGEYIPLREYLPFLEKAFEISAGGMMGPNFNKGWSFEPLPLPLRPGSSEVVQMIPCVCFEDTVGRLVRKFARKAPQVIVNVTNDGWFNRSWANEQHWRNAAFRAIELRRSMVRAANTGVTVALAPSGAVISEVRDAEKGVFVDGSLFAELPVSYHGLTLYALLGDWAVAVCGLFVLGMGFFMLKRKRKDDGLVANGVFRRQS